MIGKRRAQPSLFDVGNVYPVRLRSGSFEVQSASAWDRLFRDEDFAVAPLLAATVAPLLAAAVAPLLAATVAPLLAASVAPASRRQLEPFDALRTVRL